jgi:hypothetical protein
MTFNANGNLTSPTAANDPQVLKIAGLADGAADMSINWNLYKNGSSTITQLAAASGVSGTIRMALPRASLQTSPFKMAVCLLQTIQTDKM